MYKYFGLLVVMKCAASLAAQEIIDPVGFFSARLEGNFTCTLEPQKTICIAEQGQQVLIQVQNVPKGQAAALAALNEREQYEKMPHYQLITKNLLLLDQMPTIVQDLRFDSFANVDEGLYIRSYFLAEKNFLLRMSFQFPVKLFERMSRVMKQFIASLQLPKFHQPLSMQKTEPRAKAAKLPSDWDRLLDVQLEPSLTNTL